MAPKNQTAIDDSPAGGLEATAKTTLGRKRRPDRGLPGDEALRDLALTYLQAQRSLWPDLAQDGRLPGPTPEAISAMAEQFRARFLAGAVEPAAPGGKPSWSGLACSYVRYSCDNSNPRSLDQQLRLQLERARHEGLFIPWAWIFADAAVSGTTADRRGYEMAKKALSLDGLAALYIDEVGRASRDAIEAMRLGRLVERRGKRLVGVSDSFDSASPTSKLMLTMFAMLQEWFVDQLRSKVQRGFDDAFRRGTNLHPPALGYRLEPASDAGGRTLCGKNGERRKMKVIDAEEAAYVLEAFEGYARRGWSTNQIAAYFNEKGVRGKRGWDSAGISQLLHRRLYLGIEILGKTYLVRDPETGAGTVKHRPRDQWKVRRARHLQIVPRALWKEVHRRLAVGREAFGGGRSRGGAARVDLYPKALIRPRCGGCGAALTFGRSGKHASFFCRNSVMGKRGCRMKGYKSVRIIEETILGEIRRRIFTPGFLAEMLGAANAFLTAESACPAEDAGPLEAEIREVKRTRDRLVRLIDVEGEQGLGSLIEQVRRHERRLGELRVRLDELKARNAPTPPPMTMADLEELLADLRGLLSQDIATAAPVLAVLTGPILVEQVVEEGKKRPTWTAKFTLDAIHVMAKLAASRQHPTTRSLEYLTTRGWTMPRAVAVKLERTPPQAAHAAKVADLVAGGSSLVTAAGALGISLWMARAALDYAREGKPLPETEATSWAEAPPAPHTSVRIADEVAQMRDEGQLSFRKIAARLGVSARMVRRAYDWAHREDVEAVASGRAYRRGRYSHLGPDFYQRLIRLLGEGMAPKLVAAEVGCSLPTVYKTRKAIAVSA